jgi:hypothetical protein
VKVGEDQEIKEKMRKFI